MDWNKLSTLGARIGLTPRDIRMMFDPLFSLALGRPVLSLIPFDEWRERRTGELDQSLEDFLRRHYTPKEVAFWKRAFGIDEA